MAVDASEKGKFTGRHMAIIMVAFFAVIIAVNLTMATLASRSWTGLVVKNSYVESQKFNSILQQSQKQATLGWKGELSQLENGIGFKLTNNNDQGVQLDKLAIIFGRPATETQDFVIGLQSKGAGNYSGELTLKPGAWSAEVVASRAGQTAWKMNYRIVVRSDGTFSPVVNKTGAKE